MKMGVFSRKGPSGFSSSSTAEEVTRGIDGTGLTAIVTGASSGIGMETARVLALRGVHVVMAVRNMAAGEKIRDQIVREIPAAKVVAMELDLSSMASVKKFTVNYNSTNLPLNILINNAGVSLCPFTLSEDGIELQFATNHLGHFLLTLLLLDNMKRTSRETGREGRIVNVSSEAHNFPYREGICFDRLNDQSRYNRSFAYGQSKLANILHANELARRLKGDGINVTANSLRPGIIVTNILRHDKFLGGVMKILDKFVLKSMPQGAATTCYVALHPQVNGVSGEYFNHSNLAKPAPIARDLDLAQRLWDFSLNLVVTLCCGVTDSSKKPMPISRDRNLARKVWKSSLNFAVVICCGATASPEKFVSSGVVVANNNIPRVSINEQLVLGMI